MYVKNKKSRLTPNPNHTHFVGAAWLAVMGKHKTVFPTFLQYFKINKDE